MKLQFLIIHESLAIRKIVQHLVMTENNNALSIQASSAAQGLELLQKFKYDVVLCGLEMMDLDGFAIYEHMKQGKINQDTAFIIMTATNNHHFKKRLLTAGIEHFLSIPFSSEELTHIVKTVCNPRKKRVFERYYISNVTAITQVSSKYVSIDVINISQNGILCDLVHPGKISDIVLPRLMTIQFPEKYNNIKIENIYCRLLRMTIDDWHENHIPEHIRCAWNFVDFTNEAQANLRWVLDQADRKLRDAQDGTRELDLKQIEKGITKSRRE